MKLKIVLDQNPSNPRTEWDNIGTMVTWHRRYRLGDKQPNEPPADWEKENIPEGSIKLPIYLFDHSGLTLSTSDESFRAADSQKWDWGRLGTIFVTPDEIKKDFGEITEEVTARVTRILKEEVAIYDQYMRGEVWGWELEDEGEATEGCFGFYGDTLADTGMLESIPEKARHLAAEAWVNRS
jgi:hypothetical protein